MEVEAACVFEHFMYIMNANSHSGEVADGTLRDAHMVKGGKKLVEVNVNFA